MKVAYSGGRPSRGKTAMLKKGDEMELIRRWCDERDYGAREQLIKAYRPHALRMAREAAARGGMSLDDLIQEADAGLMEAIDNFDSVHKTRISTLARWYIRGRLMRFRMNYSGPCRVGTNYLDKRVFSQFRRVRAQWEAKNKRRLDDRGRDEVARAMGVKREVLDRMEPRIAGGDISLDAPIKGMEGEDGGETYGSTILVCEGSHENHVIERHDHNKAIRVIKEHLSCLPQREQIIVQRRLLCDDPRILADLSDELGITKERVRQIERNAINTLRSILEGAGLTADSLLAS